MGLFDFFKKKQETPESQEALDKGLEKTKEGFFSKITKAVVGKATIDDEVLDNLEEVLVMSDVGVTTTLKIVDRIQQRGVGCCRYLPCCRSRANQAVG